MNSVGLNCSALTETRALPDYQAVARPGIFWLPLR
jgi:hypothetical protein